MFGRKRCNDIGFTGPTMRDGARPGSACRKRANGRHQGQAIREGFVALHLLAAAAGCSVAIEAIFPVDSEEERHGEREPIQ